MWKDLAHHYYLVVEFRIFDWPLGRHLGQIKWRRCRKYTVCPVSLIILPLYVHLLHLPFFSQLSQTLTTISISWSSIPLWISTFSTFLPPSPCLAKLLLLSSPRKSASSTQIWLHDFVIFSFRFQASFTFLPMYVLDLGLYRLDHLHFRCST